VVHILVHPAFIAMYMKMQSRATVQCVHSLIWQYLRTHTHTHTHWIGTSISTEPPSSVRLRVCKEAEREDIERAARCCVDVPGLCLPRLTLSTKRVCSVLLEAGYCCRTDGPPSVSVVRRAPQLPQINVARSQVFLNRVFVPMHWAALESAATGQLPAEDLLRDVCVCPAS